MSMIRLFKPGDRVKFSDDGPVMEVIKYISKHDWFMGDYVSDYEVECAWYDPEEGRKVKVYDQRHLYKLEPETIEDDGIENHNPIAEEAEILHNPNSYEDKLD